MYLPFARKVSWLPEIAWYAYLLLLAMFLFGSALSILSASPTVFDGLDVPMAATALVGVFGFVSRMRILSPVFWRVFMPALLAWDIAYNFVLAGQLDLAMQSVEPMEGFPWDLVAGVTFLAPMYVALFLYGYRSKPIWDVTIVDNKDNKCKSAYIFDMAQHALPGFQNYIDSSNRSGAPRRWKRRFIWVAVVMAVAGVLSGTAAYFASGDHRFVALMEDIGVFEIGDLLWRFETRHQVTSSPAVADGVVYAASFDGHLYAVDRDTGDLLWRYRIITSEYAHPTTSPTVVGGVVYIGVNGGPVYAFSADTGSLLWRSQPEGGFRSQPAVVNGVVYVGSDDHHVYALSGDTGDVLWRYQTGSDVVSSPAVVNGVVYIGSVDNHLYALSADTGELLWRYQTNGAVASSPAVANGVVYVGSWDHHVYALDSATGDLRWRYKTDSWTRSSPTVANGIVYIGSGDGNLYALIADTGWFLWRYGTGNYVFASPTVANGVVYFGSADNHLYALNATTGKRIWRYETGSWVRSSPAVVDGVVYVGSWDRSLYALSAVTAPQ